MEEYGLEVLSADDGSVMLASRAHQFAIRICWRDERYEAWPEYGYVDLRTGCLHDPSYVFQNRRHRECEAVRALIADLEGSELSRNMQAIRTWMTIAGPDILRGERDWQKFDHVSKGQLSPEFLATWRALLESPD